MWSGCACDDSCREPRSTFLRGRAPLVIAVNAPASRVTDGSRRDGVKCVMTTWFAPAIILERGGMTSGELSGPPRLRAAAARSTNN